MEVIEENGNIGLALIHVDGAWQTEECVIPLEPTPTKVQLADVWRQLHRRRVQIDDLDSQTAAHRAELARVCPENSSLIALKESVEFWKQKCREEISDEGNDEVGPLEAKAAAVKLQLSELAKRKDDAGRKVKALDELAQNLGAACSALIAQRKELKGEFR